MNKEENKEAKQYPHGIDWMRREIFKQELLMIKLRKENGQIDERSIEQWLTDTISHLDKMLK